jgi:hypothetical protein
MARFIEGTPKVQTFEAVTSTFQLRLRLEYQRKGFGAVRTRGRT